MRKQLTFISHDTGFRIMASMHRSVRLACATLLLMAALMAGAGSAKAGDTIFVNGGAGKHATTAVQLGTLRPWGWQYELGAGLTLTGGWEFNLEWLRWNNPLPGRAKYAYGIGVSPLFRLYYDDLVYLEGTVGAHAIINATASGHLGTVFEFGDMGGIGFRITDNVRVGYRFLHFSNAGIKKPNGGVNLHMGRIEISY